MLSTSGSAQARLLPAGVLISLERVALRYAADGDEHAPAVKDLSLQVARGEFAVVVGPSGCGKSTLMKLVSGLMPPNAGTVVVDGREVRRPIKMVGMAFQNPALLPWRTALENVLLPMQIVRPHRHDFRRNPSPFRDSARALLAKVGLSGISDRFGWQLSGGMQQRVSLCRALIHEPEILLLDEPFAALDAFTREELWDTLQMLWEQRKCTVLLVTHDLVEAAYLADTIHVMSARPGRIIYSTRTELPRPRTSDVRFTPDFTELVHAIRAQIGHAKAMA